MPVREHDLGEIRDAVAKLCASFPMEYWRETDRERRYPTEFVRALTEAGWLSCLIPEEYGGAGLKLAAAAAILEEIQKSGANGAACHAQMYTMGTVLRHCSEAQKRKYLPKIAKGELRLQAFGITEPSAGTDTSSIRTAAVRKGERYLVNGQKVWTSRAEHSDLMLLLARTTPREQVQKKTEGLSVFIVDMKAARRRSTTRATPAAPNPPWRSSSRRRRPGRRATRACRPTAGSASPRSTTSNASSARRGCTRSRRSRPISCCATSPSTFSACRVPTRRLDHETRVGSVHFRGGLRFGRRLGTGVSRPRRAHARAERARQLDRHHEPHRRGEAGRRARPAGLRREPRRRGRADRSGRRQGRQAPPPRCPLP